MLAKEDYYFNEDGLMVFTKAYHLKRGTCCGNKCLHCPYAHENVQDNATQNKISTQITTDWNEEK